MSFYWRKEFLVRFFDTRLQLNLFSIAISCDLDQESINNIISKDLKPSGIAYILILADSENCKKIQSSLIFYNMIISGYLIILGHSCLNNSVIDGSLLILPSNDIYSVTEEESYSNSLAFVLKKLENGYGNQISTKFQLWNSFQELKKSFEWDFTIINQQNSSFYSVGKISNEALEITENITYPGGSTNIPASKISIWISGNVGSSNPPGYSPNPVNGLNHEGSYFAIKKINESKEVLQNFIFKLNDQINCGASVWIYNYAKSCYLENKNEMGVAYLASYLLSISINTLNLFKNMNMSIPMASGVNSATPLTNSTIFPTYTRVSTNSEYMGKTWVMYMKVMGWTSCVVFYADDAYDVGVYQLFLESAEAQGIKILNKEEYRKIPFTYNTSQLETYRKNFQDAIDQNCNIFFLFMADPSYIYTFDSFYDMGMRRGDALFLLNALTGSDIFFKAYGYNTDKIQELFYGTFFYLFQNGLELWVIS
ncbi:unnamed protein product [Blepharisma stoltei]|uniref:Receptor ligand binding region domain-containing protein n=1 Tax=Blepharisma stoltei TaxID=1481888 RepID=A0AAU9JQ03_9CILI|nr:unnamed protein product [Blepharisma stoltei]